MTLNSDGYNAESGSADVGIGSSGSDDTITPADSITDIIQSSPYDRHAGTSWDSSLLLLVTVMEKVKTSVREHLTVSAL